MKYGLSTGSTGISATSRLRSLRCSLADNPDLRDETDGIALVNLKSGENLFPGKGIT